MTLLSDPHLISAIQGVNDALRYNRTLLQNRTATDLDSQEEYLWTLTDLAHYLKAEYTRRAVANPALPAYASLSLKRWMLDFERR